jgi:hypothetical protein
MANVDRPNGFRPFRHANGAAYNGAFERMIAQENVFLGDLVEPVTTGILIGDGGYQEVARAETGDPIVGVVVGWEPNPADLGALYHASSATRCVYVARCDDLILLVQNDGAMSHTDVGFNVDFVVAAGSTATGASNMEVNSATEAVTATLDLRIVGFLDSPSNETTTANAKMLVRVNRSWQANQVAGV